MTDTKVSQLIINQMTKEKYDELVALGQINENELYLTSDGDYSKSQIDALISSKQDTLVSGTNIKTINNQSLLGEGNITIQGGGTTDYPALTNLPQVNSVTLTGNKSLSDLGIQPSGDYALRSEIPTVPTNVSSFTNDAGYITNSYHDSTKQDVLTAGTNITITNNVISASGSTPTYIEETETLNFGG